MKWETKGGIVIVGVAILTVASLIFVVMDPQTTVRFRNDTSMSLVLGCSGTNPTVAPGDEVSIRVSIFNPFPCLISETKASAPHHVATWIGCLDFDPLVDHETRLSRAITHVSLERCWANAPR